MDFVENLSEILRDPTTPQPRHTKGNLPAEAQQGIHGTAAGLTLSDPSKIPGNIL